VDTGVYRRTQLRLERHHAVADGPLVIPLGHLRILTLVEELAGLTILSFPAEHRRRLRTNNAIERFNEELKRRTRVIRIFPNRASALRLNASLCIEQSEEWLTGRRYLDMELLEQ